MRRFLSLASFAVSIFTLPEVSVAQGQPPGGPQPTQQIYWNIDYSSPGATGCLPGPCPDPASTTCLDVHVPSATIPGSPTLLLIHGGGWNGGSRDFAPEFQDRLVELGYRFVTIDYTLACDLAPSFPQAVLDVRAAVAWIRTVGVAQFGLSDCIVVFGSSAGGHLAAMIGALGSDSLHFAPPNYPGVELGVQLTITLSADFDLFRRGCQTSYCQCARCPQSPDHVHSPEFKGDGGMTERFVGVKWGNTSQYTPYPCPTGPWNYQTMSPGHLTGDPFLDASPVHWLNHSSSPFYMIHSYCDALFPTEEPGWMIEASTPYGIHMVEDVSGCGHAMRVLTEPVTAERVDQAIRSGLLSCP